MFTKTIASTALESRGRRQTQVLRRSSTANERPWELEAPRFLTAIELRATLDRPHDKVFRHSAPLRLNAVDKHR
jgi:hypothetical protein